MVRRQVVFNDSEPSGGSVEYTFKEDTNGDGSADNTATFTDPDRDNEYPSGFENDAANDVWVDVTLSGADVTSTPTVSSIGFTILSEALSTGSGRTATSSTTATANKATGSGVARTPDTSATSSPVGAARAIGKVNEANAGSTGDKATGIGKQNLDTVEATATPTDAKGIGKAESGSEATLPAETATGIGRVKVGEDVSGSQTSQINDPGVWVIDGTIVTKVVDSRRNFDALTLEMVVKTKLRDDLLSTYRKYEAKSDAIPCANGKLTTAQLTPQSRLTVEPPDVLIPPRQTGEYYVSSYSETVLDARGERYRVKLGLLPEASREPDSETIDQSRSSGEWKFELSHGTISTDQVTAKRQGGSSTAVPKYDLELLLTGTQAKALERSATYLPAVSVREVADGVNLAEDNSTGDRNTVTVTAPSAKEAYLPSDTYVIKGWQTIDVDSDAHRVSFTLIEKA